MKFSNEEIRDIAIAIIGLVVILVIKPLPHFGIDLSILPGYLIGIVLGFILHELAHKMVAIKFGASAFFKLWPQGLVFGLMLSLISSLKVLAPGAVVVYAHKFGRWKYRLDRVFTTPQGTALSRSEMGLIAVAGPVVNIIFAFVFAQIPGTIAQQISYINAFLAVFNLLPFPPLDGSKVLLWNGVVWAFAIILAGVPIISALLP